MIYGNITIIIQSQSLSRGTISDELCTLLVHESLPSICSHLTGVSQRVSDWVRYCITCNMAWTGP